MNAREIRNGIMLLGVQDWSRRLFDSLIPLPDGTSYNSYLIPGSQKTALIDTVDPDFEHTLINQLKEIPKLDYVVSLHAEQDHSGSLPMVLKKYPESVLICSAKAKPLLMEHLNIPLERIRTVDDNEEISLGDRTLRFIYTPWVHWPETMSAYLPEDRMLFSCDFMGSHLAGTRMYAGDDPNVLDAAKRYYAEIMMPFRSMIKSNIEKLRPLEFDLICPSHGPIWDNPETIMNAYAKWISDASENKVVIPYISMHGSTAKMVEYLTSELADRHVEVNLFDLAVTDIGKLAMELVDATTIVIGTPTVHVGPHPNVAYATILANAIKPKAKYAAVIGSYGWASKAVEHISAMIPALKVEVLGSVLCKGEPNAKTYQELSDLAELIASKHNI
ncbi:MAG: FprA family A-type flavoprotein [Candidatus Cloacimonetes bacterium]|jgi:flavorubredoxin|nr:FprA family A-type flavoprotein [Candidatus Cloacimonadota bacterium]MDY0298980.1 FprA family A-type flavoprotein [Candidatus Cloacimonadaceae bacterium]MCB5278612.1 FprA family A-type flavoprotein [Candidatus Cloacimonadota bacterium]MCK9332002.1 FprA family A-type flavoprotein [Candidatus Cloacimonadota bacterium]MDD2210345.1 FprA family A-type flavoprotein [Candidatus Cloacimonadota bacterium]